MGIKCGGCGQVITGRLLTAVGKSWHPEHFVCFGCKNSIGGKTFYENGSNPYCADCNTNLFSPKCGACKQAITGKCLTALDKKWHPEHFVCTNCKKPFDEKCPFHEQEGMPFCRDCFGNSFGTKCAGCKNVIDSEYITAMDKEWHPNCFVCQDCHESFGTGNYFEADGNPVCELDYHRRQGTICFTCDKPLTGKCISAMDRRFHPEHFICAECKNALAEEFHEHNNKPYCVNCFTKVSASAL